MTALALYKTTVITCLVAACLSACKSSKVIQSSSDVAEHVSAKLYHFAACSLWLSPAARNLTPQAFADVTTEVAPVGDITRDHSHKVKTMCGTELQLVAVTHVTQTAKSDTTTTRQTQNTLQPVTAPARFSKIESALQLVVWVGVCVLILLLFRRLLP